MQYMEVIVLSDSIGEILGLGEGSTADQVDHIAYEKGLEVGSGNVGE